MNSYESLFTKEKIKPTNMKQEDIRDDEETEEHAKEEKIFIPFSERKTHWGDKEERPRIPNVATVIPPGLPPPILKTLLLRMQLEEALYNVNHLETDAQLAAWCEESLDTATWSVSRNQSQSGDSINIYPGGATDSYTLTVQSNSEVDVLYKIIISNLPADVEVDLDNTGYLPPTASGSLTIETANTVINYNDAIKTKTHTLTFRATSEASFITNQKINIDVEFRQDV